MNAPERLFLHDVQAERDPRNLRIGAVGVKGLRYPVALKAGSGVIQTIATFTMTVALPPTQKGTHMSRFVELLEAQTQPLDSARFTRLVADMLDHLQAASGAIEMRFPYFMRKAAPVSGVQSLLDYEGRWVAETRDGATSVWAEVAVPVKSLCPCSKEISDYGAHNQRSLVTLRVELLQDVAWHELVRFAEDSASSELWPLLKRVDEKWITERAYENPKFVEDLVRDVALRLNADARVGRYAVDVENFESIHNHSAYARIERA